MSLISFKTIQRTICHYCNLVKKKKKVIPELFWKTVDFNEKLLEIMFLNHAIESKHIWHSVEIIERLRRVFCNNLLTVICLLLNHNLNCIKKFMVLRIFNHVKNILPHFFFFFSLNIWDIEIVLYINESHISKKGYVQKSKFYT